MTVTNLDGIRLVDLGSRRAARAQRRHAVVGDFSGNHRVIQRITLRGDRPA